jgi:hypothetical protein
VKAGKSALTVAPMVLEAAREAMGGTRQYAHNWILFLDRNLQAKEKL